MAKGKAGGGVQNRAIYSRISFLQQAAITLSSAVRPPLHSSGCDASNPPSGTAHPVSSKNPSNAGLGGSHDPLAQPSLEGMSRRLATDLRAVSLKTRIRLKPAVKQTLCKFCDSVLVDGQSCTAGIENKSKGARKPWADVLVRKCHTCGRERRYPVGARRPERKTERASKNGAGRLRSQERNG